MPRSSTGSILSSCGSSWAETGRAGPRSRDADAASDERPGVVVDSTDTAIVYFTSGTTSRPKMVEHTHVSYPVGHLSTMYWIGVRPGDVHMTISAPGWGKHAWSLFFSPWIAEATVFVYNYRRFDAVALAGELDRAGVNTFCAPPTVWRMLIQADLEHKPRALRELLSAGEPLNPEVIATIERWWGIQIRDGYGQTELTAVIGNTPGVALKPGSMGRALPGVEIVLLDPLTGEVADEGEICLPTAPVRPLNLTPGYIGEPERTAKVEHDGYYHTSDVAVRDAEGFLTSWGARTTCSRPATSRCRRSRWSRSCSSTRPWPRPVSSAPRMRCG